MEPDRFDAELGRLRDAWRATQPAREPRGELEHEDAATRASVEWLQRAWKEVAVPAAHAPRAHLRRPIPRVARTRLLLAAAALLAAGASLWIWLARRDALELRRSDVAEESRDPRVDLAPHVVTHAPATEVTPRVEAIGSDLLVLRSGPVRLYLATGASAPVEDPRNMETHR